MRNPSMPRSKLTLLFVCVFMISIFISPSVPTNNTMLYEHSEIIPPELNSPAFPVLSSSYPTPMDISEITYTDHARIIIDGDIDFLNQKTLESWNGTGSESDPIEISGYNFTSSSGDLISISNTDLYFELVGNYFDIPTESFNAISLDNVTNGVIANNYFDRADIGISMNEVNFTSIIENHIATFVGVTLTFGINNSISENYLNASNSGIMFFSSTTYNNVVFNNTFQGSTYGVYFLGAVQNDINLNYFNQMMQNCIYLEQFGGSQSSDNMIRNNLIVDSIGLGVTGIYVSPYSHNNDIYLNTITNVTISIRLAYGDNNTISDNLISNTTQAISIEYSQWNEVYRNNISDVTDGFSSAYALFIYRAHNNTLNSNNVTDVDNAVSLYQSSQNNLHHNTMTDVRAFGMIMLTATLNSIHDNEIVGGTTGFDLGSSSTNNTLSRNILRLQNQGIQLRTTSHFNTFDGNRIVNATNYGIDSTTSSYLRLLNNTIFNSGLRGINIDPSSYHVIAFNTLTNNGQYGIYLDTGFRSKIYNNSIKYHSSTGAYVINTNQHNISFNILANNTIGLAVVNSDPGSVIGNTFSNNSDTGLYLGGSDGCEITDNLLEYNGIRSIWVVNSDVSTIANNTLNANLQHGIVVQSGSTLNFIQENEITNNLGYGIWLSGPENWVRLNTISNNDVGVFVDTANTNWIEANLIQHNTDGIHLYNADSNSISLNTIYSNSQYGVYSESSFPNSNDANLIYNNTVISNGVYGVYLYATAYSTEVKWNDFINNTAHGADSNPSAYGNVWDENFFDNWDQQQSYYTIDFDTSDYNPATSPLNPSQVHYLLPAVVLAPIAFELYTTEITISWIAGYDSDDHMLSYSLYYSNNTGVDWYLITNGLTNISYYWNATSLTEGSNYQLMIVTSDLLNNSVQTITETFSVDTSAPQLGIVPTNFTVELSFDPLPELSFSATDTNPDFAYIEWNGYEMSEPTYWSSGSTESLFFFEGSVQYGVGVHALYLVVLDTAGHESRYLFYMTVEDTINPSIVIEETNQTFELGDHGSKLTWTVSDLAAGTYDAYFNGSLDMSKIWVSNTGTELDVDGYMPGLYNVTIIFYDTSGNSVQRSINMTVVDTTAPAIAIVAEDEVVEFGSIENNISWTIIELDPSSYNIIIDSVFIEQISYDNGTVLVNIDGLSLGNHNFTVVFFDNSGNSAFDSINITVIDTITPVIGAQSNVVIEFGSIGTIINWTASDLLPANYTVLIDDDYWVSGSWSNDSVVSINVDGLAIGNHSLQIVFADSSNNQETAEITISVQDTTSPELSVVPENLEYVVGTSDNTLAWTATDLDPGNYSVYIDDTLTTNGVWTSSVAVVISVDGLTEGTHTIEIRFFDTSGNMISNSVTVTVVIQSSTSTSPSTTTTTSEGSEPSGNNILGIVAGVGSLAVITIVLGGILIKKKAA